MSDVVAPVPQSVPEAPVPSVSLGDRRRAFGQTLRSLREARGLSIAALAQTTRIGAHFIAALEAGALEKLPGEVFGRGYVRCLAKSMKFDATEILVEYDGLWESAESRSVLKVEIKNRPTKVRSDAYATFLANMRSFVKSGVPLRLAAPTLAGVGLLYALIQTPLVPALVRRARGTAASVAELAPARALAVKPAKHAGKGGSGAKVAKNTATEVESITDTGDVAVEAPAGGVAAAVAADPAAPVTAGGEVPVTVPVTAPVSETAVAPAAAETTPAAATPAAAAPAAEHAEAMPAATERGKTTAAPAATASPADHDPRPAAATPSASDHEAGSEHAATVAGSGRETEAARAAGREATSAASQPNAPAASRPAADSEAEATAKPARAKPAPASAETAASAADGRTEAEAAAPAPKPGDQVLELTVTEHVRVKLDVDQGESVVKELEPDTYRFTFTDKADMMVYDAAAVKISFNGRTLGPLGGKGRVRRLSFEAKVPDGKKL